MSPHDRRTVQNLVAGVSLAVLGIAATAGALANGFVQDELSLVLRNETVHSLTAPWRFFTQAYWHDPFPPALYRPLQTASHALQWAAGGGDPRVFRWASMALLIGAGFAFWRLAALVISPRGAWIAAALFMVHPVHTEATALAVNQGEIAVTLLLCIATAAYVRARQSGELQPRAMTGIAVCFLAACLFKENALVLPGLLLAAELTVLPDPRPIRARLLELRPLLLLLVLVITLVVAMRTAVLGGDSVGTPASEAIAGSGPGGRALTMLGVPVHWTRLLFWPAQLQADYGPREISTATAWQTAQWLGALVILAWGGVVLWAWRRLPALALALLWIAVAVFPVSNILVPTGIVLAERTLFLASAGASLAAAALLSQAWSPHHRRGPGLQWAATAAVAILISLGMMRSATRGRAWKTQGSLLEQTVIDAPRSYGAHLALGRFLDDSGKVAAAAPHFREAAALNPSLLDRERSLGDQYRRAGLCRPAVRHYRVPLVVRPAEHAVRASTVACLLHLHRYHEARTTAEPGLDDPAFSAFFARALRVADSALAARR